MLETVLAAFLVMLMVVFLFFGIKHITHRDISAARFGVQKFKPEEDEHIQKAKRKFKQKEKQKKLPRTQKIALIAIGSIGFATIALAVSGKIYIAFIAMLGGFYVPNIWYNWNKKSQERMISSQVEQATEAMSIVLRSGGGMAEAIEKGMKDIKNPFKTELEQTLYEMKLGKPEAEVLQGLSERVPVPELEMLAIASELQRDGMAVNMANVLNNMQSNIRTRQGNIDEIRAITAENRMAVWIVAIIPFVMIAIMRTILPEFKQVLFENVFGIMFSIVMFSIIIFGIGWALKIANVEDAS